MVTDPDILIVGAGPCSVSAAFPLVEAGLRVAMVDAGGEEPADAALPDTLAGARMGCSDWQSLLGKNGLSRDAQVSPKLRLHETPGSRAAYRQALGLSCDGFVANGRFGAGGLSRYWGAATPVLGAAELETAGLPAARMAESYRRVMRRIGVSGDAADYPEYADIVMEPLRRDALPERLFERYRHRKQSLRLTLETPWQAVLSRDHDGRRACNYSGLCLWGCARESIYDAAYDVKRLQAYPNFTFLPGQRVMRIARQGGGYALFTQGATLTAPRVVLAAGVLGTTRLALDLQQRYAEWVRIENTPAFAIACLDPRRMNAPLPREFFALSQLALRYPIAGGAYAWGSFYGAYGVAASDLIADSVFSMASARRIVRHLMPSLSIAFFYFPGSYSDNRLELRKGADGGSLHIKGGVSETYETERRAAIRGIKKDLLALGLIPLATRLYPPGGDAHLGATLSAGLDEDGQLRGFSGLYIADTSALPSMPAKHPTLTAMANADRIARGMVG